MFGMPILGNPKGEVMVMVDTDSRVGRQALFYSIVVIALAALTAVVAAIWAGGRAACADAATALCDSAAETAVLLGPTVILLAGGVGAFVRTYVEWRRGRRWPFWQGAGWFLFVLMIVYLGIGASAVASS